MKKYLSLLPLSLLMLSCVQNPETGEMETTWLFWTFFAIFFFLLVVGLTLNAIRANRRKNNPSSQTKSEKQIESYEKTLEDKEK